MYKYNEIKNIHLEITEKCNSKCSLCPRYRSDGKINFNLKNRDLTINDIKKIFSDDIFLQQIQTISFCGNYGDPICNNDLLEILHFFRNKNKNIYLKLHTNGSLRSKSFWEELAKVATDVTFSIDGLEDTNHIYRQNTSYSKIIKNAKTFIQAGGYAVWDYIVFRHNEHQVEKAETLSKELGFKKFIIKKTSRIDRILENHNYLKNPLNKKYRNLAGINIDYKNIEKYLNEVNIDCFFGKQSSIYISAEGLLFPCCWLGLSFNYDEHTVEDLQKIKKIFKDKKIFNAKYNSIQYILEKTYFEKIKQSWKIKTIQNGKIKTCSYYCSDKNNVYINQTN